MSAKKISVIAVSLMLLAFASQNVLAKAPAAHPKQAAAKANKQLSGDRAIALVRQVKEVQDWENAFGPKHFNPATQGRPGFSIEEIHGSVYTINAFEDKPEQALTFARFEVNVKTGKVKKVE
ncbi:MAG: hypothetical protein HYX67_04420 [Candidatus Melainabacteria bacterium]|nr:hypothetical protein [Candidatus Melainabacteria bacterium]